MATFKAEVYAHQRRSDGTYNIKIRVTQNQKKKYLGTVWYVTKDDLTRSLKLKNQRYIDLTEDLIRTYRARCERVGERIKTMSVEEVVRLITSEADERFELDIVAFARQEIERMIATGHKGNAYTYNTAINSLTKFARRERVMVSEITVKFLKDWIEWLREQPKVTRGYVMRNYLSALRAIHNRAKKEYNDEDAGVIRIPNSPFTHIDFPKLPTARKRALTVEQVRAIANLKYSMIMQPGLNRFNFARDVFLISFCLVGMNAVDLYECRDFKDGRITYQRTKTKERRADKAEISIKIEDELMPLFEKYRDKTGERVFNFYRLYGSVGTFSCALNKGLKKIGAAIGVEDLEFYAARHSWATIALNDAGVDKYTVHTALNHVDDSMRVTDIYIRKSFDIVDKANRRVMDLMKLSIDKVEEPILPKQKTVLPKQNFETD